MTEPGSEFLLDGCVAVVEARFFGKSSHGRIPLIAGAKWRSMKGRNRASWCPVFWIRVKLCKYFLRT